MNTKSVVLNPGDELPKGRYVTGWKLNPDYGKDRVYLTYEPAERRRKLEKASVRYELKRTFPFGWWVKAFIGEMGGEAITEVWFFTKRGAEKYASEGTEKGAPKNAQRTSSR